MHKTYQPKAKEVTRNWHLIDVKDQVLGRVATDIATRLMGKHKATYSAHMDSGDYVVVVNAKEVKVTGNKRTQKAYKGHSGYPGGYKEVSFEKMMSDRPERVIEYAVWGMLPDNRLRAKRMARLKVYSGSDHKYQDKLQNKEQKTENSSIN
jgi:large subunit ribosomal protein L13